MWTLYFWPPVESISKKICNSDYVHEHYPTTKFGAYPSIEGFSANGWNITQIIFIYLFIPFFGNSPTAGQTGRWIFTFYGSNDADSRKDVSFWGFIHTALHLGGQIAPKPQFWERELAFSSDSRQILKLPYFQNYYINWYKILHSVRDHEVLFVDVQISFNKIQDGGRPPSWKIEKS